MPEQWVLNASPIIVLTRVGLESLLWELPDRVVVPHSVVAEIEAGPADDPARRVMTEGRFPVVDVIPVPEILAWDLGAGETAVLSYALRHPEWSAVLDDAAARKCARSFQIRFRGTLAVILMARQRGLIPSAAEALRAVLQAGFYLDERVIREALERTVGERWVI